MGTYQIFSGVILPPRAKPGPKKGSFRYNNLELIREAADGVVNELYASPTDAAKSLIDRFLSAASQRSKITMFVRKIQAEVRKVRSSARQVK
jgi:hypothetical protein